LDERKALLEEYSTNRIDSELFFYQMNAFIILAIARNFAFVSKNPEEYEYLTNAIQEYINFYCMPYMKRLAEFYLRRFNNVYCLAEQCAKYSPAFTNAAGNVISLPE
jgi:hypothetical protein